NELLTFSFAKGSDLWLHASHFPGSHVILRVQKQNSPDQESILDAAHIALYYSKAKDLTGEDVTITECKWIKKIKGKKKGEVGLAKHRRLFIKIDSTRLKRLFSKELSAFLP
ncbi:MAG: hypothetical protein ACM3JI_03500, partial [Anaerolineae bacterium]